MALIPYNKKRNFKSSPEPAGKMAASKSKLSFVVQRHKASHLHYDFRLEVDGVLKSWAVPKGPSMNPQDKRLAMMVEDHPYSYRKFSGIIPEGNYGAGIVEIWDSGEVSDPDNSDTRSAEKKIKAGLRAGNLKFRLQGKKLKGEFALVKLKGKQENAWLLIKHRDTYAVEEPYNSEEHTPKNSPINSWLRKEKKDGKGPVSAPKKKSGKVTSDLKDDGEPPAKRFVNKPVLPGKARRLSTYIQPMLAMEADTAFDGKDWIYELKWDGYRAIAEVKGSRVSLYSRHGNVFNDSYPLVVEALKKQGMHATLDGEVVIVDENGKSNFQRLQHYQTDNNFPMEYRVFDLLALKGKNLCDKPLLERKNLLKKLLGKKDEIIKYSDHIAEKGKAFFEAAVKKDLEGIMAKKIDSLYYPGTRTRNWLKIKHHKTLEAIIAGYTQPGGSRDHFGALVLGVWNGKALHYIGHTGSGFNAKNLQQVHQLLKPLIQKRSAFAENVKTNMPVTWVKPLLVCEIKYTEWTLDGHLRHPIFLRLREEKQSAEITLKANKPMATKEILQKTATKKGTLNGKKKVRKIASPNKEEAITFSFGKIKVKTTHLQKLFWPNEKISKGDVIRYYQSISKYILPYLKQRPQSLKRNPNGIMDRGFFHKDAGSDAPDWVQSKSLFSASTDKQVNYILCNNAATLAYLNNLGCIELNPWHSTITSLDRPDYLILDIDPSERNSFEQVIQVAQVARDLLKQGGTDCYCKTSGATGMHLYVPARKKYTYDQLKDFAQLICLNIQEQLPDITSLERNLKKRGKNRIYLDHLQNRRGQTICSVYSLRPVPEATVSMPLKWSEVKPGLSPRDFTIHNALKRIEKTQDLFLPVLGKGLDLRKCLKLLDKI